MKNSYRFLLILLFTLYCGSLLAQDAPVSVGPAPITNFKIAEDPVPFLQIGTRAFTQLSVGGTTFQFGKSFLESCTITNVGAPFAITFPGGLLYYNGKIYTWNQSSPFQLWQIDTVTGVHTFIFNMTGVPQANLTGMYWDGTTVFGVSTTLSVSQIFTVNMNNGVCTPIGAPTATCAGAVFLTGRYGAAKGMYSVDIVSDNFFKWNKITGVPTLIGPLGVNANFGQDACFDNNDGKLYWMSYTTGPQLRTIDTATGTAGAVLCSYTAQGTGIATAFYVPPLLHDYLVSNFLSLPAQFIVNGNYVIKAKVINVGSSNESNVPIKFFINGTLINTVNLTLNSGAVDSVGYQWTPVSPGSYTLAIASALSTDLNRNNDTVRTVVNVLPISPPYPVYSSCKYGINKLIPDLTNIYDSIYVNIGTWNCWVRDVNVKIDTVIHTWDSDLQVFIKHHGVEVNIIDHVGGSGDNFIGTILNDSATVPIANGTPPFTGSFIPSNPLSALNGYAGWSGGYWVLRINDGAAGDTGILKAWCLTIQYEICEGVIGSITVPNYYALGQNYPNPFNPTTKIEYAIPRPGDTKITVYDVLGREVTVLVNEFKYPGIYTVDFDASNLSSGVYFYKMQSGSFTDTKKMLVIK